ncbi:unnamed protein product [Cuscuta epithymum]|uniref:Uncharacterized protein n=1 Tax=Cuscuta epithymum TaxID=186058 RepID=A0AAV0E2L8_9ASTE|nr:unnamed protein product [Cuscuta epithymum]
MMWSDEVAHSSPTPSFFILPFSQLLFLDPPLTVLPTFFTLLALATASPIFALASMLLAQDLAPDSSISFDFFDLISRTREIAPLAALFSSSSLAAQQRKRWRLLGFLCFVGRCCEKKNKGTTN